jgi:hypothetical protein
VAVYPGDGRAFGDLGNAGTLIHLIQRMAAIRWRM